MADAGHIFYSQVDENLQTELNRRGSAGASRTTADLDYMLGKVANVQLTAYDNAESKEKGVKSIHVLGGNELLGEDYLPAGFLQERGLIKADGQYVADKTYKVPPFITSCEISMNDHTMGMLNSATVTIVIPNPNIDLDHMESIYARPGRAITLEISYPDSAVIGVNSLTASTIQPAIPVANNTTNTKLSTTVFDGLIISFNMSYNTDATVTLTVHLRGTSNVYTDVSMLNNPATDKANAKEQDKKAEKQIDEFYNSVYGEIHDILNPQHDKKQKDIQIAHKHNIKDPALNSLPYGLEDSHYFMSNQFWDKEEHRYIQLGQLIRFVNKYIMTKQTVISSKAQIICNDEFCFSNYYEKLISADPENIWIPSQDVYGKDKDGKDRNFISQIKKCCSRNNDVDLFAIKFSSENNTHSFPSRMFINLKVIKNILTELSADKKTYKLNDFLVKLNSYIVTATGGAINMELITHPENPDYLLYYDKNYLGNKQQVTPYSIPMMSNHPYGTVVKDFHMEAKLPSNMQALMYTANSSDNISEEQIAPYMNFMYNNSTIKREGRREVLITSGKSDAIAKLEEQYKASHEKYLKAYTSASQEFGDAKKNESKQKALEGALQKYIQFPTPSLNKSSLMQSPIYPYEVEFTIEGINGFRYGDALSFEALPKKYQNGTTFSVISVTHTVNTNGEWDTKIKCIMRPHF